MRSTIAFLLLTATVFLGACQTAPPPSATRPGVAQPPGPMDTVTNPMNQPRSDRPGTTH